MGSIEMICEGALLRVVFGTAFRTWMCSIVAAAVLVCACGPGGRRCGLMCVMCVWYLR